MSTQAKRLLDQVREISRFQHQSIRTERAYVEWVRRYVLFHSNRPPAEREALGSPPEGGEVHRKALLGL